MKRACVDCSLVSSIEGSPDGGTISCRGHSPQRVSDVKAHLNSYVCDNFEPRLLASPKPSDVEALNTLRRLADVQHLALADALRRWLDGPPNDVAVAVSRGPAMLSVAEAELDTFESDARLKSYTDSNHVFADLLVPAGRHVSEPILFWLSEENPGQAEVRHIDDPPVFVIALGRGYGFGDVVLCIARALERQGARLAAEWFTEVLTRNGVDPTDARFDSIVGAA